MDPFRARLEQHRLGKYAELFTQHSIGLDVLADLTDADLEKLGIPMGDRRRFLKVASSLAAAETLPTQVAAPGREAERRQLTVMFSDLVDSTKLAAHLDPEDMKEVIAKYQKAVSDEVARFGGYVAKSLGDGLLIYFGWPQAHEDDAEQAVRSGLAAIAAVQRLAGTEGVALTTRIGMATGEVVVGDFTGVGVNEAGAVIGETPNLAARLQALAEPGAVVIPASTRRLIGGLFEYESLGRIEVKGFVEPIEVWRVLGEGVVHNRFEALRSGAAETPLVGREEELGLLLRRWQQIKEGEGRVVLLSGEPGIGKSRLAAALQEGIKGEPHIRVQYFCSPHHRDSALHPFTAQLGHSAGFGRDSTVDAKLTKLEALLVGSARADDDLSLFADLLSIPDNGRYRNLGLTPQRKKEMTFDALLRQLTTLARQQSVLFMFEDVHWIDPTSRELLDIVIEQAAALPMLLLITFRPEFQPPWVGQSHVMALTLNRLDRREGAALVGRVVGKRGLPDDIVKQIVDRTDGVPLFLEELTAAVLEAAGDGDRGPKATTPSDGKGTKTIPATLHASLMARLDRLDTGAKEVAQIGAAIGREFAYELVAAVSSIPNDQLNHALAQLTASGLVFQHGAPPGASYTYKHALIQDAAYGTLLRGRRRDLHAHIAAALQSNLSATRPEIVAHHMTEAGLKAEAVKLWTAAGENALASAAHREASAFFERSLALLGEQGDGPETLRALFDLRRRLHDAIYPLGELQRAQTNLIEAENLAERLTDPIRLSTVLSGKSYLLAATGDVAAAIAAAERALTCLAGRDAFDAEVNARMMLARSLYAGGRYRDAIDGALEPLVALLGEEVERSPSPGLNSTVNVHVWLTLCLAELGDFETAAVKGAVAMRLAVHSRCGEHEFVWSRIGLGRLQVVTGEFASAIATLGPALPLCKDQLAIYFSRVASSLGSAYAGIGRVDEGLSLLQQADSQAQKIGFTFGHALVLAQLGRTFLLARETDVAQETAICALQAAQRWGERGNEAWARCLLGDVATARRRDQEAETNYQQALEIAEALAMTPVRIRSSEGLQRLVKA